MQNSLYIVATPIGNLSDITLRALEVLKTVDIILAEDTRRSKKLLQYYNITTPMRSFHEHNEQAKTAGLIDELLAGKNMALISDAGTPLISDPGYVLVSESRKSGIRVVPIPGASALISAISAAGIASNRFSFFGFLPSKQSARLKAIRAISQLDESVIFYESPKRILACAKDLQSVLGRQRLVCFARELTKTFETIKTAVLSELIAYLQADQAHQKGEFVIIIAATDKQNKGLGERQLDKILPLLLAEMGAAKAAKIAAKITGIDKKYCYHKAIEE